MFLESKMYRINSLTIFLVSFRIFLFVESISIPARMTHLIFPGTNWCGVGNIAANDSDLGSDREVDKCCRDHDHCKVYIAPGEYKYGLFNIYFIPRLTCNCDEKFYNCLNNTTSPIADLIGNIYFNMLHYPCFAEKCPQNQTLSWGQCHEKNNKTREYQWFDVKYFD